jgi:hypothetical protein
MSNSHRVDADVRQHVLTVNTIYIRASPEAGLNEIRRVPTPSGRAIIGSMPKDFADEKAPPNGIRRGLKPTEFPDFPGRRTETYFRELLIEVNLSFRFVPRPLTTAMMASEIPAAIRPYSMAVAPDSSEKKLNRVRFNTASLRSMGW